MAGGKKMLLNLTDIIVDMEIQQRDSGVSQSLVSEYTDDLEAGAEFPRVRVFRDSAGLMYLTDGFHRWFAHQKAGRDRIKAEVFDGSKKDAIIDACGANGENGARRTNADKRKAVATLDAMYPKRSARWIAERARVSHFMVESYRSQLAENANSQEGGSDVEADDIFDEVEPEEEETVTGTDGKEYKKRKPKPPKKEQAYPTYARFDHLMQGVVGLVDGLREDFGSFGAIVEDDGWNPELTGVAVNCIGETIKELETMKKEFENATEYA